MPFLFLTSMDGKGWQTFVSVFIIRRKIMLLILYLAAIIIANIITAALVPLQVGPFLIPYGSWLIGVTLVLRDIIQRKYGRKTAYLAIITALVLSAVSSKFLGDGNG
jgi:hypothetical protein